MYMTFVLYIKYVTNSSRLVPPSAPARGVFIRGTESERSSLTSSGSPVDDGPLDLISDVLLAKVSSLKRELTNYGNQSTEGRN